MRILTRLVSRVKSSQISFQVHTTPMLSLQVQPSDTCQSIVQSQKISSIDAFFGFNPSLHNPGCDNLKPGSTVCLAAGRQYPSGASSMSFSISIPSEASAFAAVSSTVPAPVVSTTPTSVYSTSRASAISTVLPSVASSSSVAGPSSISSSALWQAFSVYENSPTEASAASQPIPLSTPVATALSTPVATALSTPVATAFSTTLISVFSCPHAACHPLVLGSTALCPCSCAHQPISPLVRLGVRSCGQCNSTFLLRVFRAAESIRELPCLFRFLWFRGHILRFAL